MSSVPRPTKIEFDSSGNSHLVCVENDAIDIVQARLESSEFIPQNIKILQLGGTKNPNTALHIEQFNSMANLKSRLTNIYDRATMGTRFYAIGSSQFVWHLRRYARSFGLSEAEISLEVVSNKAKNVYCSNCLVINSLVRDDIFICSGCEIKLEVAEHFSRLKNAYLGICANAETLEASEVKL